MAELLLEQSPLRLSKRSSHFVVAALAVLTLLPWVSTGEALLMGVATALTIGNPWPTQARSLARRTLMVSVVGLGAGMNLTVVGRLGLHGVGYTALGIACAFLVGTILGRRLGVARDTSLLVTVGTAICGGSAIAAVAPAIGAKDEDVSVALVAVFLLNGVALFVFPLIGHSLHLGQDAFGLWCALAIHDTSSVVGAASQYGDRALEVATAAKLARALWIVPVVFVVARVRARSTSSASPSKGKHPWFIAGFVAVAALVTFVPAFARAGHVVTFCAHRTLGLTLFLIGLGLSRSALRSLGIKPFVQATALWLALAVGTLVAITSGLIA